MSLHAAETSCDCLIVGGGPAGASLAWLLASTDVRVVLVDDGRPRYSGPLESLLSSATAMLQRAGLADVVRACAEPDSLQHGSIWGSDEMSWRPANDAGWCLRRGAFDTALRRAVAERGAVVHEISRVVGDLARAAESGVEVRGGDGRCSRLRPRVVVLATGRDPSNTQVATRIVRSGPATFALTFVGTGSVAATGIAVVEATPEGWAWLQAPADGPATVGVLLDAGGALPVAERARSLLAQCRGPAASLRSATVRHAVDATARCIATDDPVLLLGDAAATIDPLASQGVEKSFAAADHAAAVVRTMLRDERLAVSLLDEHRRWEHGLWEAHRRQSARFHGAETRFSTRPFWRTRSDSDRDSEPARSFDGATLRLASGIRRVAMLRRIGDTFEPCEGAELGSSRLTHLGFVPIGPLLDAFATPATVSVAMQRAGRDARCFVLPPFAVQQALHELDRRGWLIRAGNAAGTP